MRIHFPVRRSPTRIPLCCTFFIIKLKHSLSAIQCMLVSYLRTSPFHPLQNYYTLSNRQVIGNCLKGCLDENNWCVGHGMLGIYHRKENNKILENLIQEKTNHSHKYKCISMFTTPTQGRLMTLDWSLLSKGTSNTPEEMHLGLFSLLLII